MTRIEQEAWKLYCEAAGMGAGAVDHWEDLSRETQVMYIGKARERRKYLTPSHPAMEELLEALGFDGDREVERVSFDCTGGKLATVTVTRFMTVGEAHQVARIIKKFDLKERKEDEVRQYG